MKFEEALTFLRKGAKIWCPFMPADEYYMACRVGIIGDKKPTDEMPVSIVWMKAGLQHPDMRPYWNPNDPKTDPCRHGFAPMINLLWLMSEEWKIVAGII